MQSRVVKRREQHSADTWQATFLKYLLWCIPVFVLWQTPFIHPLRLFTTLVHELGHLVAAEMTGGTWVDIAVDEYANGHILAHGGIPAFIAPAGYLGTALFAIFLFWCSTTPHNTRLGLVLSAIVLNVYTLASARHLSVIFSLGLLLAWIVIILIYGWSLLQHITIRVMAIAMCFNSIYDIYLVLFAFDKFREVSVWHSPVEMPAPGSFHSDATIMAARYGGSEGLWALCWLVLSFIILFAGLILSIRSEISFQKKQQKSVKILKSLDKFEKGQGEYTVR